MTSLFDLPYFLVDEYGERDSRARMLLKGIAEGGMDCHLSTEARKAAQIALYDHDEVGFVLGAEDDDQRLLSEAILSAFALGMTVALDNTKDRASWLSELQRDRANRRHSAPNGSRDKQDRIRSIWASGKYASRDICAEQECAALGMSFSTARRALRNTPDPHG